MKTNTAYLGLGSNLGDKISNLRAAARMIDAEQSCSVVRKSSVYLTKPVGVQDQPDFLNAVVVVETTLAPAELLRLCKQVEERLGRKRTMRWGPRVIDIDILLYDSQMIWEDELVIPHPQIMERAFVLAPLAEVAPDVLLADDVTAAEALRRVDQEGVRRIEEESWGK